MVGCVFFFLFSLLYFVNKSQAVREGQLSSKVNTSLGRRNGTQLKQPLCHTAKALWQLWSSSPKASAAAAQWGKVGAVSHASGHPEGRNYGVSCLCTSPGLGWPLRGMLHLLWLTYIFPGTRSGISWQFLRDQILFWREYLQQDVSDSRWPPSIYTKG